MALYLNLLHEKISQERQRKRDPLKLGLIALATFGAILFLYYGWNAYQTLEIKSQLNTAQAEWAKVEPQVTAAQKRATELTNIINGTAVLDGLIERRFYWAPLLTQISHTVAPNIQLTSFDGSVAELTGAVTINLEGLAAAREPRAAAEDFRQLLSEQLEKTYKDVRVEFKTLEDLDTVVNVAGAPMPRARFVLTIDFTAHAPEPQATPEPVRAGSKKK